MNVHAQSLLARLRNRLLRGICSPRRPTLTELQTEAEVDVLVRSLDGTGEPSISGRKHPPEFRQLSDISRFDSAGFDTDAYHRAIKDEE